MARAEKRRNTRRLKRQALVKRLSQGMLDCVSLEGRDALRGTWSEYGDGYHWEDSYCKDVRADPTAREAVVEVIIETLQAELGPVNGFLLRMLRKGENDTGTMARQVERELRVKLVPLEAWTRVEFEVKPALAKRLRDAGFSLRGHWKPDRLLKRVLGRKLSNGKHTPRKEESCISTTFLSEYRRASKSPAATSP